MILLYFAWVRQKLGTGQEWIEIPSRVRTVRDLAEHLRERGGAFEEIFSDLGRLRVAVDQEHAVWEAHLGTAREVAFFPPVTGG